MPIISEADERAGRRIVSGQEAASGIPDSTYEDHVDTNTNNRAPEGRVMYNGQEMTLEEMGRQPLPEVVQEHYERFLEETRGDSVEVNPGTPDATEERTMGPTQDTHGSIASGVVREQALAAARSGDMVPRPKGQRRKGTRPRDKAPSARRPQECKSAALDILRQSAVDSSVWRQILASPSVAQFARRSLTGKASRDSSFARELLFAVLTGRSEERTREAEQVVSAGTALTADRPIRRRRLCFKQGEALNEMRVADTGTCKGEHFTPCDIVAGPLMEMEDAEYSSSSSWRPARRRLLFKQSFFSPSCAFGPLNMDLAALVFSFVEVQTKVTAACGVSRGLREVFQRRSAWDPLKLDKDTGRKLLRKLKVKDPLGYFLEEGHRTKRYFPSGFFDVQHVEIVLMDPERVEHVQSDTEDEAPKPQATLIPDPLDEVLKRLKHYFSDVTDLIISNIEDYRMDYRFVGLRCSSLGAFGFVQLQHHSNPATYELRALRDDPPKSVDLKAIKSVNSSRIPWAVRVDQNTTISEREALFLQEHLSAYKNGSDFFLAHAIYRSVPSHTVRKRYKAVVASLSRRFPQQFQTDEKIYVV
eukprot:s1666_g1.t1